MAFAELGLGEPVELIRLEGGSGAAFRVERRDADAVTLKIYDDIRHGPVGRETYAASLLAEAGIPITRFLAVDETRGRLPVRYSVSNYIPGNPVAAFRGEPEVDELYRQMGHLLRRLHGVGQPAFGHFDANGIVDPVGSNVDFVARLWASVLERFRHFGAAPELADKLHRIVAGSMDIAGCSSGPVFAHDDFQPNNVLGERYGEGRLRLTGLIDFGNARAADATFDLAKTLFCCEHEAPGSTANILAGYGAIDHPEPEAALWFYTLIHRVIMWCRLRHIGVIADAERHDLIVDLEAMAEQKQP